MADLINASDSLNKGRGKLNTAIQQAERAENKSIDALAVANDALDLSTETKEQLDTIVLNGDSSVEAAQARVSSEGTTYTTLKQRLDEEYGKVTSDLAQREQEISSLETNKADKTEVTSLVNDKADKTYVDTKVGNIVDGSPKGTYATLSELQTAFPTGTTGIYVVSGDGKWYFWNGSAWTAGGVYQAKSVGKNAISYNSLSKDVFGDGVYSANLKATGANVHAYATFGFDTSGITLTDGATIHAKAFVGTEELGIQLAVACFQAHSLTWTDIGGVPDSNENGLMPLSDFTEFETDLTGTRNNLYRYVKLYFKFKNLNATTLKRFIMSGVKCVVDGKEIPLVAKGVYSASADSTNILEPKASYNVAKISDVHRKVDEKWNFMGDSITRALYWKDSISNFAYVTKPYHQHLKELLGLSVVRNYGIESTTISAVARAENAFVSRYQDMDNDADSVVVFGGTNDFGISTPLGTFSDRTDVSFYGALHVLMSGLIDKYPGKRIIFMTPLQRKRYGTEAETNSIGLKLSQYVDAIKEVARYYSIPVIDTNAISGITPYVTSNYNAYINDGLHPNEVGHELLAKNIVGQFEVI